MFCLAKLNLINIIFSHDGSCWDIHLITCILNYLILYYRQTSTTWSLEHTGMRYVKSTKHDDIILFVSNKSISLLKNLKKISQDCLCLYYGYLGWANLCYVYCSINMQWLFYIQDKLFQIHTIYLATLAL
jgi:hypothetical protein